MRQIKATFTAAVLAAVAISTPAHAERFSLTTEGSAAYYAVTLDANIYIHSARIGLADLRVRNSANELLPYTLETPPAEATEIRTIRDVPWFPLPATAREQEQGLPLGVTIGRDGALRAVTKPVKPNAAGTWVLDLSQLQQQVTAVLVGLSGDDFQGGVEVQASNDLQSWRGIGRAQLLRLSRNGTVLSQERIELARANARYLRLIWQGTPPTRPKLQVETITSGVKAPIALRWRDDIPSAQASDGSYLFDSGGQFPAERIRVRLPQINTVAQATLWSRTNEQTAWREVSNLRLYRLAGPDGEQQNEPIVIRPNGDRFWKLSVDSRTGGLGSGTPVMAIGWRPSVLTFVARGTPPFLLTVAETGDGPAAVGRSELLVGDAPSVGNASILAMSASPLSPIASVDPDPGFKRRMMLWAGLFGAVAVLALMAWKLFRAMGTHPLPEKEDAP